MRYDSDPIEVKPRRRTDGPAPGDLIKDPTRCPMCAQEVLVPRHRDYDDYLAHKNVRCLDSSNPICAKAVAASSNQPYIKRILSYVARYTK